MKKNILAFALLSAGAFASTGNATPAFLDEVSGDVIHMFSKRTPVSVFLGTTAVVGGGYALWNAQTPVRYALRSVRDGGEWVLEKSGLTPWWQQFSRDHKRIATTIVDGSKVTGGLIMFYGSLETYRYLNS